LTIVDTIPGFSVEFFTGSQLSIKGGVKHQGACALEIFEIL